MWNYSKRLQYPIRIKNDSPQLAKIIITQYGGPYIIRGQCTYEYSLYSIFKRFLSLSYTM